MLPTDRKAVQLPDGDGMTISGARAAVGIDVEVQLRRPLRDMAQDQMPDRVEADAHHGARSTATRRAPPGTAISSRNACIRASCSTSSATWSEAALPRGIFVGVLGLNNGLRGPPAETASARSGVTPDRRGKPTTTEKLRPTFEKILADAVLPSPWRTGLASSAGPATPDGRLFA